MDDKKNNNNDNYSEQEYNKSSNNNDEPTGNEHIEEQEDEENFYDCDEEEFAEYAHEMAEKREWMLRTVALVTVLVFFLFALFTSWPSLQLLPLGDLISRSLQLEKDIDLQHLQEAVVQIQVVSRATGILPVGERKSGTGFNIDAHGLIVTNHHVIQDALNMSITFPDGGIYKAVKWSSQPELDLAVITLEADQLPVAPLNLAEQPVTGDKVRVVGNPLGLNNIIAEGQVEQYLLVGERKDRVFSISAPIYPGNSGSPVYDRNGQVIGVVFANLRTQVEGEEKLVGLVVPIGALLSSNQWPVMGGEQL